MHCSDYSRLLASRFRNTCMSIWTGEVVPQPSTVTALGPQLAKYDGFKLLAVQAASG